MTSARSTHREALALGLLGLVGVVATAVGLALLAPSDAIGFQLGPAVDGILGELGTTVPATALVSAVALLELATGLVLARLARRLPFESVAEALLAASVATVLKDLLELSVLGQVGLFRAPLLALIDVVVLVAGWRLRGPLGPVLAGSWRPSLPATAALPLALLVLAVWAGPILLQLASPVVPFVDVLPNHVAPAEHLRTFGAFTPLTATQSPIYGPSRSLLGYVGLLGAVTTLSGIPATLAAAAFVLPTTILIGVGAYQLVVVASGGAVPKPGTSKATAPLALLAFALTGSFARLSDDRATVVVLPLVAFALAFAMAGTRTGVARRAGDPAGAWRLPDGVVLGLAVGAAILVHPVIGALTAATVGLVGLVLPRRAATLAVSGLVTAAIVAAPQATTMVGLALPSIVLVVAIVGGIAAGLAIDAARAAHVPLMLAGRIGAVAALAIAFVLAAPNPADLVAAPGPFLVATALLLLLWLVGYVRGVPGARDPVLLAGLVVGFGAAVGTQAMPGTGLLSQGLRFELPKTLYYWIPVVAAVAAGATLDWPWRTGRIPGVATPVLTAAWLVVAAVPLRPEPIDAYHLGEHRFAEALAIDLRWAGTGYWAGYPDSRMLIDGPRQEIVTAVRAEIAGGRIGPDTPVLHVAESFQQWVATPLGVLDGVTESDVSPDAEDSIHTVGGRLLHLESLDGALRSGAYPYLLVEPGAGLPADLDARVATAGYVLVWGNSQGTLYRLGP